MEDQEKLKGLGGWLILMGIGVTLAPIRLLVTSLPLFVPMFQDGTWHVLTTNGAELYHPFWEPLLIGEMLYNSMMFIASIYLIYLFFSKNYLFPRFYIGIIIVSAVFIPLDSMVVMIIDSEEPLFDYETTKEFARVLINGAIWIPYLILSKRVKATFIRKSP